MFFAMFLFAALLVALVVLAFFRFRDRPNSDEIVPPASYRSGPMGYQLSAISRAD